MTLQVDSLNTVKHSPNPQVNTSFKANPVATTNTLERTPTTDTLVKPAKNKTKKALLTLGAIVLAGVGIFGAIKLGKAHQQKKAIQEIEKKFADLRGDMPRVQKTFKEVFLREDLTEKEALEMLNRYKEIEKIGITGTKEEYALKLFDEAKRNYGFGDIKLPLYLEKNVEKSSGCISAASTYDDMLGVEIFSDIDKNKLVDVIHHELRHVKQKYFSCCLDEKGYFKIYAKNFIQDRPFIKPTEKNLETAALNALDDAKKIWKEFSRKNLPDKYEDYAKKCLENYRNYTDGLVNFNKYQNQFMEEDARFAGESIAKLFGL